MAGSGRRASGGRRRAGTRSRASCRTSFGSVRTTWTSAWSVARMPRPGGWWSGRAEAGTPHRARSVASASRSSRRSPRWVAIDEVSNERSPASTTTRPCPGPSRRRPVRASCRAAPVRGSAPARTASHRSTRTRTVGCASSEATSEGTVGCSPAASSCRRRRTRPGSARVTRVPQWGRVSRSPSPPSPSTTCRCSWSAVCRETASTATLRSRLVRPVRWVPTTAR